MIFVLSNVYICMYRKFKNRKMVSVFLDTKESVLLKSKDKTFHVLFHILRQMDFEHNTWYADKTNKIFIMNKLGIAPPTLDKHLSSLKERELILPTDSRGRYRLNLEIFEI